MYSNKIKNNKNNIPTEQSYSKKFQNIQLQDNRNSLPQRMQSHIESISGLDMSDVKVHRNSNKPAQLNALAYTQGTDIHIGPGQERHLGHEAWHAVQQMQDRVEPTIKVAGQPVNDSFTLEKEADDMGSKISKI